MNKRRIWFQCKYKKIYCRRKKLQEENRLRYPHFRADRLIILYISQHLTFFGFRMVGLLYFYNKAKIRQNSEKKSNREIIFLFFVPVPLILCVLVAGVFFFYIILALQFSSFCYSFVCSSFCLVIWPFAYSMCMCVSMFVFYSLSSIHNRFNLSQTGWLVKQGQHRQFLLQVRDAFFLLFFGCFVFHVHDNSPFC